MSNRGKRGSLLLPSAVAPDVSPASASLAAVGETVTLDHALVDTRLGGLD
jgi:hypothetical protein